MSSRLDGRIEYPGLVADRIGNAILIRMVRADRLNALSISFMGSLLDLVRRIEADPDVNVVILAGLNRTFCVGFDLRDAEVAQDADISLLQRRALAEVGPRVCQAIGNLEAITIAAVDGPCLGGGLALALSCDFRIASDKATFALPEAARGLSLGWRVIPRLIALVGLSKARQLILIGDTIDLCTALDWHLVDFVAPTGRAVDRARELAERLQALPPMPLRMCKQMISAVADQATAGYSALERDQFTLAWISDDFREATRAFFSKDAPRFSGN